MKPHRPLSESLPGTWQLISRIDVTVSGERRPERALGEDPIALLIYDRAGNFAAQFMKRDRSTVAVESTRAGSNNTRAMSGYDAYFGTYTIDDETQSVTQRLVGSLSRDNVGSVLTRQMQVHENELIIRVPTSAPDGSSITRTLTWRRIG